MASRLSHELRTPVAVVRSSLDNLRLAALPEEARVYIERAQLGLNRLAHILTRMTEATRLEQSLGDAERERFDLAKVVAGSVDGYRIAYPEKRSCSTCAAGEMPVHGAPELIAQMLDKLVANAIEFATGTAPIFVRLARIESTRGQRRGCRSRTKVRRCPSAMQGRLFDSMVSVRSEHAADVPHLGLGLYIVTADRGISRRQRQADNRADGARGRDHGVDAGSAIRAVAVRRPHRGERAHRR